MKKLFSLWLPPILWALLIFALSSRPVPVTTEVFWQDFILKKSAHIVEYFILSITLFRAFRNSGVNSKKAGFISILCVFLYAATDEYHQSFVPGRQAKIRDMIFDTIGGSLGILTIWNLLPKAPVKLKTLAKRLQVI